MYVDRCIYIYLVYMPICIYIHAFMCTHAQARPPHPPLKR